MNGKNVFVKRKVWRGRYIYEEENVLMKKMYR